ncbi:hypothetical protein ESY86_15830 [Subsaximicrobium wynnwilliamsii]|uniref:PNPLA domain-containing protein n=1 Tax=Subsaximicrobium wynnwilliamsii TaxID=291179 RepID=A0A5C6ZEX8_9FLAO|nr:hypothetical protein [Subsaximicrobium wynnwilliamsii]TXD82135.1 hypothetical protein ESY87_15420 [Subsaximicrobium wynnwilliamsii]TXD87780.1 hypothetical protein ESY86_15830 [Subsaximicrobium wynnwilliamsii]TXE01591.1 hypothetical protein ESY88_15410 [Subsaximicrobium wynnwilliamsii]
MGKENTFHLGITMAGAVSAGAYTAGFIDYLIEALELWEEQKLIITNKIFKNETLTNYEKKIPLHNVCIDVLGGASAGGMVGMITALSTYSKMPPVKKPTNDKTGNILYDSWVLLDDDIDVSLKNNVTTFQKMLYTDDFEVNPDGIPSLLNSKSIDRIADKVFNELVSLEKKRERPNYISEDLRVLVTLCSLRGIPFELNFERITSANFPYSPGHRMNEHMIIAHFKIKYDEKLDKDVYLKFDPYDKDSEELLKLCTKATGAFPIGLAPRHFEGKLSTEYIKNCILRNLEIKDEDKSAINIKLDDEYFDFTDIDGGTINNEPYSEVVQVLEEVSPNHDRKFPMFGTIMIDPFPNFYDQDEFKPKKNPLKDLVFQKSFWSVIPEAYFTFREQVRVKHSGSFYKDYFRLLIFPVKWEQNGVLKNHPPIACGALGGFGGFLDIEFRKHDFFLGRNNARNFLRGFFMLEYNEEKLHPLFSGLNQEAVDTFRRKIKNAEESETIYFPIIPDLNFISDKKGGHTNPYHYTIDEFPKLKPGYFDSIKPNLKNRVNKILTYEINKRFEKKWLLRNALKVVKGYVSKRIVNSVIKIMEKDFASRNMMPK